MYLLDTDTISTLVKRQPAPGLVRKVRAVPRDGLFTSAITIAELYYGIHRAPHCEQLLRFHEESVLPYLLVLPFDQESGRLCGRLRAQLEKRGRGVSEPDLKIAAIAIQHNYTLVTGNTRHFRGIPGLKLANWIR